MNIIPTPRYMDVRADKSIDLKDRVRSVYIESGLLQSCAKALEFLPQYISADKEHADLVITNDTVVADIDYSWFENENAKAQGYIIKGTKDSRVVIYAPSDIGIMYGICTFIQITGIKSEFEIKDYPDFLYRSVKWLVWAETGIWSYDLGDGKDAYVERIERNLDTCLKYKINMIFFDACGPDTQRTPHYEEIMKKCTALARERGIRLVVCAYTMGYGLSGHQFGKFSGKVYKNSLPYPDGEEYECLGTFIHDKRNGGKPYIAGRTFGTCISNDQMTDDKIAELTDFITKVNPGALYLHNMDSCYVDSALWNARCDNCRKRWPNDDLFAKDGMAGAFAYYLDRINGALKSVKTDNYDASEDLVIFNVAPGYLEPKVDDYRVSDAAKFWAKVQEYSEVTKNVIPLFREMFYNKQDSKKRIPDVIAKSLPGKFGVISFAGSDGFYSDKPITLASILSFMYKGASAVITCSGNAFAQPLAIIDAQYMWNCDAGQDFGLPDNYDEFIALFSDIRTGDYYPEYIFGEYGLLHTVCHKLYGNYGDIMFEFFTLKGKDGEYPILFPCNKELGTAGNNVLLNYRWDNELTSDDITVLVSKFGQIKKLNYKAKALLSECTDNADIKDLLMMLNLTTPLVDTLCDYMKLYKDADLYIAKGVGDKDTLLKRADAVAEFANANKGVKLEPVDVMGGANSRREELFETVIYNLGLIKSSLKTDKRIPDDRKQLQDEYWW